MAAICSGVEFVHPTGAAILIRGHTERSLRSAGALLPDAHGCSQIAEGVWRGSVGCCAGAGECGAASPAGGVGKGGEAAVVAAAGSDVARRRQYAACAGALVCVPGLAADSVALAPRTRRQEVDLPPPLAGPAAA